MMDQAGLGIQPDRKPPTGLNSIPVNVSMLAPGTYFVRVGHARDGCSKQFLKTD